MSKVLEGILKATKEERYDGISDAVLIGHSFGGLVLEKAAIRIIQEQLAELKTVQDLKPAADLVLLLNEAGPAWQARPRAVSTAHVS